MHTLSLKHTLFIIHLLSAVFNLKANDSLYYKDIISPSNPPKLVNDFANMLTDSEIDNLEYALVNYDNTTSTQIVIVTIPTLGEYPVEEYGIRLARKWQIGSAEKDNGILILIARDERKIDIQTGWGIGQYISDIDANQILRVYITPKFKEEKYYEGLHSAIIRMQYLLSGKFKFEERDLIPIHPREPYEFKGMPDWLFWMILLTPILLFILFIYYVIKLPTPEGEQGTYRNPTLTSSSKSSTTPRTSSTPTRTYSSSGSRSTPSFRGYGGGKFGGGGASGSW